MAPSAAGTSRQAPPLVAAAGLALALAVQLMAVAEGAPVAAGDVIVLPKGVAVTAFGTLPANVFSILKPVTVPAGSNPAILLTLTPVSGGKGADVDLFCNAGMDPNSFYLDQAGNIVADFSSESIGVNQDQITIPPLDSPPPPGESPVYICGVYNPGWITTPINFRLRFETQYNYTGLEESQRATAKQLFDRCCTAKDACALWKDISSFAELDTDLCQFGDCDEQGRLISLNIQGWEMVCTFPGDLFAQFASLQRLYVSYNNFTGDINAAAANMSALPDLQEWSIFGNNMTGTLDDKSALCNLTQATLEALRIDGNPISGTLPACLFNGNSTLFQFSASYLKNLTGSIPDAFAKADRLQSLTLAGNNLRGSVPASLASDQGLIQVDLSQNKLTGALPFFSSPSLTSVDLSYNNFSGAVPDGYAGHPTLYTLDLKENNLTALPEAWSAAPDPKTSSPLNFFRASYNQLQGGFPTALAGYPGLVGVYLGANQMSGPLPNPSDGDFPALRALKVSENYFNGSLGDGWEKTGLFQLAPLGQGPDNWNVLNVSYNQLSGVAPAYLANAQQANVTVLLGGNVKLSLPSPSAPAPAPGSAAPGNVSESSETGVPVVSGSEQSGQASTSADTSSGSGGLSAGAIAGIVVGVLLAVAIVGGVVLMRRSRRGGRNFTEAGGNSSKFARFDDMAAEPANGPPPHLELSMPPGPSPANRTATMPAWGADRGADQAAGGWGRSSTF